MLFIAVWKAIYNRNYNHVLSGYVFFNAKNKKEVLFTHNTSLDCFTVGIIASFARCLLLDTEETTSNCMFLASLPTSGRSAFMSAIRRQLQRVLFNSTWSLLQQYRESIVCVCMGSEPATTRIWGLPLRNEMMEDCVLLCNILVHQFARRIMGDFGEYGGRHEQVPMLLVLEIERMFGVVCLRSN